MPKAVWGNDIQGLEDGIVREGSVSVPGCIHKDELQPGQPCLRCNEEGHLSGFIPAALTAQDVEKCVRTLSEDQRQVMIYRPEAILIAGGFVRSVISGDRIRDVDYFLPNRTQAEEALKSLREFMNSTDVNVYKSERALTLFHRIQAPSQLIYAFHYEDPTDIIKAFDLTVCQACIWYGKDGNWRGMCGSSFYQDLAAKRLVYCCPQGRDDQDIRLLSRVIKHLKLGYHIPPAELGKVVCQMIVNCQENISYEPGDLSISEKYRAKVAEYIAEGLRQASVSPSLEQLTTRRPSRLTPSPAFPSQVSVTTF